MAGNRIVVLFSGGMDSATTLAWAKAEGFYCYALSFDYGQRHAYELIAARQIAQQFEVIEHKIIQCNLGLFGGSALTDAAISVPSYQPQKGIPVTYVPARNTLFLSMALAWAEVLGAWDIAIGVNAVDYSGYPDCRPQFISTFELLANLATKAGVEGRGRFYIHAPLLTMTKAEIIGLGVRLGVDYSQTVSCYNAGDQGEACGYCDACHLRRKGFESAGVVDPTRYVGQLD